MKLDYDIRRLIDIGKHFYQLDKKLTDFFKADNYYLAEPSGELEKYIFDKLNIPEENAMQLYEKSNFDMDCASEQDDFYCRDFIYTLFYRFYNDYMDEDEFYKELEEHLTDLESYPYPTKPNT